MPRERRRRSIIREVIENSPPSPADVRHLHSVLAVCGMPYDRQPLEVREFERKQGNMALDLSAGFLRDGEGKKILQPLPFGPKARLVMMHLCSEAIRQKTPTIEIAESFTAFVREMGFSDSGGRKGPLTAFKEQINALAACTMRVSVWDGVRAKTKTVNPFDEVEVWLPPHLDQRSLWPSTVTFNPVFFESLQQRALPLNANAVRAFAGSARKLDLYFWLGYRLHNIRHPVTMSWKALSEQFGQGFTRPRAFRAQLIEELTHIKEVLPKLPLKLTQYGISIEPADPAVLALPAIRVRKK
uniref:Replication protein n=1 Tax=Rhodopseudomonas palustris TaxID=1076 RepID=Q9RHL0_RHOPL|nr:replication protein [Rhodopseudomonas palustris]